MRDAPADKFMLMAERAFRERDEARREIKRLRRDCGELYQVIGTLDELVPETDKAVVVKALDNASAAATGEPRPHDDLLPFILRCLSNDSSTSRPNVNSAQLTD